MSFSTLNQLRQLGLDSNATNQILAADQQVALDAAQAYIITRIGTQFPPPILTPYPMDLIECECVVASWTLLMVRGYNPAQGNGDVNIKMRYEWWAGKGGWLDQVSSGEIVPQIIASATPPETGGASGPSVITATTRGYSERGISPGFWPRPQVGPFSDD